MRDQRAALKRIAADDPELAARLILMTLPATGRDISYALEAEGLGEHRVGDREPDFHLSTEPRTLTDLATGSSGPLGLMLRGRLRIRGKRRKAMKLRRMSNGGLDLDGYTSRQIYGFAYRTLRRRMKVLGIEIPPADEFMPGPIDGTTEFTAVPAQAAQADANGAASNGSGDLEAAATS